MNTLCYVENKNVIKTSKSGFAYQPLGPNTYSDIKCAIMPMKYHFCTD